MLIKYELERDEDLGGYVKPSECPTGRSYCVCVKKEGCSYFVAIAGEFIECSYPNSVNFLKEEKC